MKSKEACMSWEPSLKANYRKSISPCFLIKVNRLFGFEFEKLNLEEAEKMDGWPYYLKKKIEEHWEAQDFTEDDKRKHEMYIDCQGVYPDDIDALAGDTKVIRWDEENKKCNLTQVPRIEFFPKHHGISAKYFPFNNKKNKENPLIAVRFNDLRAGQLINVKCTAFYPGSDGSDAHQDDANLGTVRFGLYLDDEKNFVFS